MKHACAVPACLASIDARAVMCTAHWRMLPMDFRARVWNTYRKRNNTTAAKRAYLQLIIEAREKVTAAQSQANQERASA